MAKIYVHTPPTAYAAALRCGAEICLSGWRAEEDALFRPQNPRRCPMICVETLSAPSGLAGALIRECRECRADSIFLDADAPSPGLTAAAGQLISAGIGVFSSVRTAPGGATVSEEEGNAALITPRRHMTVLSKNGRAQKQPLSERELGELIDEFSPVISVSGELGSKYFTVRRGKETLFVVFDTADTLMSRISSSGHETVFLKWSVLRDYFGGRL